MIRRQLPALISGIVTLALMARNETLPFAATNIVVQLALFTIVACVPAWRTLRMSYIDIAWPWGLIALGG